MGSRDVAWNLGLKAARRLSSAHKPLVRLMRRQARAQEQRGFRRDAARVDRAIADVVAGRDPIIVGPWLGEVGYEVLYWVPFVRWFQNHYGVPRDRIIAVSRGGMEAAYGPCASTYVDLFDLMTPQALAAGNAQRQAEHEGGGQKQSSASAFDDALLASIRARVGLSRASVCHPSLMFELFRHVWHGHLPFDLLWRRTRFEAVPRPAGSIAALALPDDFIAVKVYAGPALHVTDATCAAVRHMVAQAAQQAPVVLLETEIGVDEHRDFNLTQIPGVTSLRSAMRPRSNLGLQLDVMSRARYFIGTCGGLAWHAPFLGVPTVALYDSDSLLGPHLYVAREAGYRCGAAPFTPLDVRAVTRLGLGAAASGAGSTAQ
jgi:hypothetical protein